MYCEDNSEETVTVTFLMDIVYEVVFETDMTHRTFCVVRLAAQKARHFSGSLCGVSSLWQEELRAYLMSG